MVTGDVDLLFCVGSLAAGKYLLRLDIETLRTLVVVTLVFSGQAVFYVSRERRHLWSSRPGKWLLVSSALDLSLIAVLAVTGVLMRPLPIAIIACLLLAAMVLALILDVVKLRVFRLLSIA
jgi:H+-transporting ATPase